MSITSQTKDAIQVKNLSKHFSIHKKQKGIWNSIKALGKREYKIINAVNNINFEIEKGEFVGFIGPNGAGKTTTLKMLSGLLYPTSGEVKVLGHTPNKRENLFLKKISLVMGQKNQLFWDLPAIETFELNRKIYDISEGGYKKRLRELVELMEADEIIYQQVRELSLGQRMKCELIAALIHTPQVLFLDEPTIGLDVVMQNNLRSFIKKYNQKYGSTIILTSHYMRDVQELCKRVLIIDHGNLIYDGSLKDIVRKYTSHKRIILTLFKKVTKIESSKYGKVVAYEPLRVTFEVERKDIPELTERLLKALPVDDLDVSEVPIEDVIQNIFTNHIK